MTKRYDMYRDPIASVVAVQDPQAEVYRQLLEKTPVLRREHDGSFAVSKHADVVFLNQHPAVLGNGTAGVPMGGEDQRLIPLDLDGPDHRKYRRLLDPLFSPKAKTSQIARLEPVVRSLANELIDQFAGDGNVEAYEAFCVPLPTIIFVDLMGLPQSDRNFFLDFVGDVLRPSGETAEEKAAIRAAAPARMFPYLAEAVAVRRVNPGKYPGLISGLLDAEVEGHKLDDREILNILFLLMIAGLDTVTASLSCIIGWLGRHPEERQRLVDDPERVPAAVEELMRYESPVQWGHRLVTEDVELPSGAKLEAGSLVQALWAASNLDADDFDDPFSVRMDRPANRHIAFASGTHRCLGSHLARLELRCGLQELNRRLPDFHVADEGQLVYSGGTVRAVLNLPISFTPR
jgi:cytochrome P450